MKVLFATKNEAKLRRYADKLIKKGIEVISIRDLDYEVEVKEDGKTALENAYIKAKAYYDATGIITFGIDDNLYFEDVPEEKQPGTHVRRVNGKTLTDDEMIEHYTGIVKEMGRDIEAKWVYGLVLYDGKEKKEYTWSKGKMLMVDTACEKRNPGYPLDSITVVPRFNKYTVELTEAEKKERSLYESDDDAIEFIAKNVLEG